MAIAFARDWPAVLPELNAAAAWKAWMALAISGLIMEFVLFSDVLF